MLYGLFLFQARLDSLTAQYDPFPGESPPQAWSRQLPSRWCLGRGVDRSQLLPEFQESRANHALQCSLRCVPSGEIELSESYYDLVRDALQWLLWSGGQAKLVIIAKIEEDEHQHDIHRKLEQFKRTRD